MYKLQGGGGKGGKSGKGNKSAGGGGGAGGGGEDLDDIKRDLDSILGRGSGGTIGVPSLVRTTFPRFTIFEIGDRRDYKICRFQRNNRLFATLYSVSI